MKVHLSKLASIFMLFVLQLYFDFSLHYICIFWNSLVLSISICLSSDVLIFQWFLMVMVMFLNNYGHLMLFLMLYLLQIKSVHTQIFFSLVSRLNYCPRATNWIRVLTLLWPWVSVLSWLVLSCLLQLPSTTWWLWLIKGCWSVINEHLPLSLFLTNSN